MRNETTYWLELIADEQIVRREKLSALLAEGNELVAIFVAISQSARGD